MFKKFQLAILALLQKMPWRHRHDSFHQDVLLVRQVNNRRFPSWPQLWEIKRILSRRERQIFNLCLVVFLIGLGWLAVDWSGKYRIQTPAVGGKYVEAVVGSPELINPLFSSLNDTDADIAHLVFSGLMRVDSKQRVIPDVAVSYELSADKKIYTFKLRQDVFWHDEEKLNTQDKKLTAKDVVFTFESVQNPAVNSPLLVSFQGVKVEAVDDYTVKFTLAEPFVSFLPSLTLGIIPEHLWSDISPERMRLAQLNLQPVGSGPFKFKKLVKDDVGRIYQFEMERFDRYYRQAAWLENFIFQYYPEYDGEGGAIQALQEQLVDGLHFVPNNLRDKVERRHIVLRTLQLPQYTSLFFNQDRQPWLQDKNLRLALAESLDKERILREGLPGMGQVVDSPILPGFPGYNPEIAKMPYSPDKANEILDKNWPRVEASKYREFRRGELIKEMTTSTASTTVDAVNLDAETQKKIEDQLDQEINPAQTFFRKDKKGEYLELDLVTADVDEYRRVAERVAGFWQEIGVKTKLEFVPAKNLSREILKGRNYDVLLYGVIIGGDPDQYPYWHSSQVDYPGLNLARYVNRNVDALLEQARGAGDEQVVVEAYKKFQEAILADLPAVFLFSPTYTYAMSDKIQGASAVSIFSPADRFVDVTSWYLKTKGQWHF